MSYSEEIGGYFGLELKLNSPYHNNVIKFNSARNALKYLVISEKIDRIYVPYYTCDSVIAILHKASCDIVYYEINKDFYPKISAIKDYLLYTNYFGICANNVKILNEKYQKLIIDNAQAFFMPNMGLPSFYSPRKFFGVPDGGYLSWKTKDNISIKIDKSFNHCQHLLKRIDCGATNGYKDFLKNEELIQDLEIKYMSKLTDHLLNGIDYNFIKKRRLENFKILHNELMHTNELIINLTQNDVPMVYPYLVKRKGLKEYLIKKKIYVGTYWKNVLKTCKQKSFEEYLVNNLVALPIDQRYSTKEMLIIIQAINEYIS